MSARPLGALALAAAFSFPVQARDSEVTRSPAGDKSVVVAPGPHGLRATYVWPGGKLDATLGVPLPGGIAVQWIDNELARVGGPCGPGCNAVFLASPKGVAGPFAYVLAVDAKARLVATSDASAILVQSLEPPGRVLAKRRLPSWCRALSCAFTSRFVDSALSFKARHHSLSIPLR